MMEKLKRLAILAIAIFVAGYLLNFLWESLHAVFFYEHHNFEAARYILMIAYVALMDGIYILLMYAATGILWRNIFWIERFNAKHAMTAAVIGLAVATIIEYNAVYVSKRWAYNELMPVVFGIGISPLIQLSLTGLSAFWVAKKLVKAS